MRVPICSNHDLMSNLALNLLWPSLQGHEFDIVLSDGVGKAAPKASEIVRWGNLESRRMEAGLFPLLDRRDAADGGFKSFTGLAEAGQSGTIQRFTSINRGDGLVYVERFRPDVIVSVRFGQILKAPVIGIPPFGVLNLHSGILPAYRGILATFWAMLRGEDAIGCTLHAVEDGTIDTGSIVGVHRIPADTRRSLLWNVASLYDGGVSMLASALSGLSEGRLPEVVPQDAGESRYFSYPERREMDAFLGAGLRLHDDEDYVALFSRYGLEDGQALDICRTHPGD